MFVWDKGNAICFSRNYDMKNADSTILEQQKLNQIFHDQGKRLARTIQTSVPDKISDADLI